MKLLSYQEFPFLSNLMSDYKSNKPELSPFIRNFPNLENILTYSDNRDFPKENRTVLVEVLNDQYSGFNISEQTQQNIEALNQINTFTITTGHQLCLFTGPLYFIYKIASVINLTRQLKNKDNTKDFVPVFWMATEDHDFEEINHFHSLGKSYKWDTNEKGGVGRMNPSLVLELVETIRADFSLSLNGQKLVALFEKAYKQSTLSKAMLFLVNELFKDFGLVILDADDKRLKRLAIPCFEKEITNELVFKSYSKMEESWPKGYKKQVNARECNLFYLEDNFRGRLIQSGSKIWEIDGKSEKRTEKELINELNDFPERFSPNVLMRPMYQEIILPNLAYIGGGGELAYWFLLKPIFDNFNIEFPYLILRNSVVNSSDKIEEKLKQSELAWSDILLNEADYLTKYARLKYQPNEALNRISKTVKSELNILTAEHKHLFQSIEHRQKELLESLEKTEKTLIRNWKKKQTDQIGQYRYVKDRVFPNGSFQERYSNFSELFLSNGQAFIEKMVDECNVFANGVLINKD